MQYKFFTLPVFSPDLTRGTEELNSFIRGHRVVNVQKEFCSIGAQSAWCCCVEYIGDEQFTGGNTPGKVKKDYREILDEESFARFRILRECRKILAEEDAVPPFAVCLDEQLAEMAKSGGLTPEVLRHIPGFGEKKREKYGAKLVSLWEQKQSEAGGKSLLADSGNSES